MRHIDSRSQDELTDELLTVLVHINQEVCLRSELPRELLGADLADVAFLRLGDLFGLHLNYSGNLSDKFRTRDWLPRYFRN